MVVTIKEWALDAHSGDSALFCNASAKRISMATTPKKDPSGWYRRCETVKVRNPVVVFIWGRVQVGESLASVNQGYRRGSKLSRKPLCPGYDI